jgi:hypothetical protein
MESNHGDDYAPSNLGEDYAPPDYGPPVEDVPFHDSLSAVGQKAFHKEYHKNGWRTFGRAPTFMDTFNADEYSTPESAGTTSIILFASADEWELASFIIRLNMTVAAADEFLKLRLVCFISSLNTSTLKYSVDQENAPLVQNSEGLTQSY